MKRPTDFPTGAAAPAGGEALPPEPATEPAAAPVDLPAALSAHERLLLLEGDPDSCDRALERIDALTDHVAEQAAQVVTDGQRIAELESERDDWKRTAQATCARCEEREPALEQFRTTVVSLTQDLEQSRKLHDLAEAECGRHRERVLELEAELAQSRDSASVAQLDAKALRHELRMARSQSERVSESLAAADRGSAEWREIAQDVEQKLAAANALIRAHIDANDAIEKELREIDGSDGGFAYVGQSYPTLDALRTHLAGQPAAPTSPRCPAHGVVLANLAWFKCGCRYVQAAAPSRTEVESESDWEREQRFWREHSVDRFDLDECGSGYMSYRDMRRNETGDWVRADDYRKDVERIEAESECCMGGRRTERWCGTQRTKAEQAVLDACKALDDHWLERGYTGTTWRAVVNAELARRGLK